jgi:hypothetical protein
LNEPGRFREQAHHPYFSRERAVSMIINLRSEHTGATRQRKLGFSWTTLFFGFWPAIFRGDWKWGVIQFGIQLLTLGLSGFVFAFIYNKLHVQDLLENGYVPYDEFAAQALQGKGFVALNKEIAAAA